MNLYPSHSFNDYHHFPDLVASILTFSICLKNFKFQTYHFISVPQLDFFETRGNFRNISPGYEMIVLFH